MLGGVFDRIIPFVERGLQIEVDAEDPEEEKRRAGVRRWARGTAALIGPLIWLCRATRKKVAIFQRTIEQNDSAASVRSLQQTAQRQ